MSSLKEQFPLLRKRPLIYLDSAATTQKPEAVIEAMDRFYRDSYGTVHRAIYSLSEEATALYEAARVAVADYLFVKPNEVIFTRGTTESLNFLAYSLTRELNPGEEILLSAAEHHANLVPWQIIAKEKRLKLVISPLLPDGSLDLNEFKKRLNPKTKIVSLPHVSNVLGVINPIQEIGKLVHKNGSLFVVDGAQAAPHLSLNLKELGVDFYALSGHKFYGPTGIGVLFGKEELLNSLPPPQGGGDMIERVTYFETSYKKAPLRFEAGTPPIAEAIGLHAAVQFVKKYSPHAFKEEERLFHLLLEKMREIRALTMFGDYPEKVPLVTFTIDGAHPLDIATLLSLKGIAIRSGHLCAQPLLNSLGASHALRVSIGLYTTEEDIVRFSEELKAAVSNL